MAILYVGIDLAKNVFAIHGVDEHGKAVLVRPSVPRGRLHQLVAALPPCTIGMEACSGAHHWARLFAQHGHTVRLMAPKFVAPYRMSGKRGKNDAADAQAICEAVAYFGERDQRFRERDRFEQSVLSCAEWIVGSGCLKVVGRLRG
jgi:transposase